MASLDSKVPELIGSSSTVIRGYKWGKYIQDTSHLFRLGGYRYSPALGHVQIDVQQTTGGLVVEEIPYGPAGYNELPDIVSYKKDDEGVLITEEARGDFPGLEVRVGIEDDGELGVRASHPFGNGRVDLFLGSCRHVIRCVDAENSSLPVMEIEPGEYSYL